MRFGRRIGLVFGVCLAITAMVARAGDAPTVRDWSDAFSAPVIAGPSVGAQGQTFRVGHFSLEMRSGRLYPVKVRDRLIGVLFVGPGSFQYVSTDPFEAAVYRSNADHAASYKVSVNGAIGDGVESVLLMLSTGVERLAGEEGFPEGDAEETGKTLLAEHLERFANDRTLRYTQVFPQAMIAPPAEPLAMAEIVAGKNDLTYGYDTVRDREEWLASLRKSKSDYSFLKHHRYADLLSLQPIGRPRLEVAPRRFMQTALDVTVVNPAGLRAEIAARGTFQAIEPTRILDLSLWSDRIGTVGIGAKYTENPYTLEGVRIAGADELPFAHVEGDLLVELPRVLQPGETADLEFAISGDVLFNPGNDSYWDLPTGSWFPTMARIDCQFMSYHAVVKVPKPFLPFSCGRTIRRWEEGNLACAEFREEKPIQIPAILAGKYTTESETRDGITVSVSSYAGANPRAAKSLITNAFSLIEFYKMFLGDYPFGELKIIEINSYGFGQAPAGVIFITKEAFNPLQDEASRLFSEGINARLAHEMAHTWWGHVAKLGAWEDQWLSESLAEYFSAFAMGRVRKKSEFKKALKDWQGQSRFVKDKATVTTANYLSGEDVGRDRYALLYAKGPIVLNALQEEIGESAFLTVCKSFLKSFNFKYAETKHFIGLTNFVTKKDYTDWFNRYLLGTEWPKE